jgi:hypothetical protein
LTVVPGFRCEFEEDFAPPGIPSSVAVLTINGSSLNLMYKSSPAGRGTLSVESIKPTGTLILLVNVGSEATESMRNRFDPLRVHGASELLGQ